MRMVRIVAFILNELGHSFLNELGHSFTGIGGRRSLQQSYLPAT